MGEADSPSFWQGVAAGVEYLADANASSPGVVLNAANLFSDLGGDGVQSNPSRHFPAATFPDECKKVETRTRWGAVLQFLRFLAFHNSEFLSMLKVRDNFRQRYTGVLSRVVLLVFLMVVGFVWRQAILQDSYAQIPDGTMSPPTLKIVQRLSLPPNVSALVWSPDGSKLATFSNFASVVTIWNASDWHVINKFSRYSGGNAVIGVAWLPSGLILTPAVPKTSEENRFSLDLWDPATGALVKSIPGPTDEKSLEYNEAAVLAVSNDGSVVAMANYRTRHQVFLFNTTTWSITTTLTSKEIPTSLAFRANDGLAAGSTGGAVDVFELPSGTLARTINAFSGERSIEASAFSPNGKFLATAPSAGNVGRPLDAGPVRIWKTDTGEQSAALGTVQDDQTFPQLAWNADGTLLSAISFSGSFYVWRVGVKPAPIFATRFPEAGYATSFAPNGTLAAAQGSEVIILK